ncbi:hypothetical protein N7455_003178 [Penicillium solitum]|uniref:uncharacterized protein n=1 Tax=Penicillium solitum TaxID=60172 RepID=UPI0032C42C72|nr:hypothetical protein N7455_003178 [Penicillium solitum]
MSSDSGGGLSESHLTSLNKISNGEADLSETYLQQPTSPRIAVSNAGPTVQGKAPGTVEPIKHETAKWNQRMRESKPLQHTISPIWGPKSGP